MSVSSKRPFFRIAATKALAPVGLELKFSTEKPGQITGYGSVFGVVDDYGDIVAPGAFTKSLSDWKARGKLPKMLWQHDSDDPIGVWTDMVEDARGLRCTGELLLSVKKGAEAYEHAKAGTIDGLSIGFSARDRSFDEETGTRTLKTVDLWEVSLVTFQACEPAQIDGVKSAVSPMSALLDALDGASISDAERAMRDAFGCSRKEAATFMSRMKAVTQRDAVRAEELATLKRRIAALNT